VADTFTGFPPGGIAFLTGLAADNSAAYFSANRGTYANDVAAPLRALVVAVGERLRDTAVPDIRFEPSTGKSLFRINRAGIMGLRDTRLDRYRTAVADDSSGPALRDLLTQLSTTLRDVEITEPARKRVPAPYPQDHPRRDLLRCDTLHASVRRAHPPMLASPAFADTLSDLLTPFAQLHRWLVDHVAT